MWAYFSLGLDSSLLFVLLYSVCCIFCVRARACVGIYNCGLMGKCMRITWPCGECVTRHRLVGNPTRNNSKPKLFKAILNHLCATYFSPWCVCVGVCMGYVA